MSILFHILADVIHIIKIILIGSVCFKFQHRIQKRNIYVYIAVLLGMLSVSFVIFYIENSVFKLVLYLFSVIAMFLVIYKEQNVKLIIFSLWISFITSLLDTMSMVLVDIISDVTKIDITMLKDVVVSCISLLVVFVLNYFLNKKNKVGIKNITHKELVIFTIVAIMDAFVTVLISSFIETQNINKISYLLTLFIVVIGIYIQLALVIILFTQKTIVVEQKKEIEKYLEVQKGHYEYHNKKEYETRKFRHDLRSHTALIKDVVRDGNHELLEEYLDEIDQKVEALVNKVTVSNDIADAIINHYCSIAGNKGISMEVKGRFPVKCNISTYDLCTIFSNLLTNAIEAAQEADEKKINLICGNNEDGEVFINLSNTYSESIYMKNGRIITNKSNKEYHGFGLENVCDSIDKYDGVIDIYETGKEFHIEIMLIDVERMGKNANCGY